jgi:hypothetical protein
MSKPKPLPDIARCVCGRAAGVIQNGSGKVLIGCFDIDCWRGPWRKTRYQAILAWNRVMGGEK